MEEMDKLKRQMSRFMNVGKRNRGMPAEFGGGVQVSPKELVKPIKPKKDGDKSSQKIETGAKKRVADLSLDQWRKVQRKHGVAPSS